MPKHEDNARAYRGGSFHPFDGEPAHQRAKYPAQGGEFQAPLKNKAVKA